MLDASCAPSRELDASRNAFGAQPFSGVDGLCVQSVFFLFAVGRASFGPAQRWKMEQGSPGLVGRKKLGPTAWRLQPHQNLQPNSTLAHWERI